MLRQLIAGATLIACLQYFAPHSRGADKLDRGIELLEAKKYQEAETVLREVVNEEPTNARAHYHLGLTLLELEKFQAAADEFKKALESTPPVDKAKIGLARAYLEMKELDQAQAALKEAQEANADNPEVYYYRGMIEATRKDYAGALKDFEKTIELDPRYAYAYYQAGIVCNYLKRPDKMVQYFQTFLKLAPDAPEAKKVQAVLKSIR